MTKYRNRETKTAIAEYWEQLVEDVERVVYLSKGQRFDLPLQSVCWSVLGRHTELNVGV